MANHCFQWATDGNRPGTRQSIAFAACSVPMARPSQVHAPTSFFASPAHSGPDSVSIAAAGSAGPRGSPTLCTGAAKFGPGRVEFVEFLRKTSSQNLVLCAGMLVAVVLVVGVVQGRLTLDRLNQASEELVVAEAIEGAIPFGTVGTAWKW